MAATEGSVVTVHYTGRLETGDEFDSSRDRDPLQFKVGEGMVIPGFEQAVVGLEVGQRTTATIEPENAYGQYDENALMTIPRETLQGVEPEVGQYLGLEDEQGNHHMAGVKEVGDNEVTLDFNHFLAGKTLVFDIEVLAIEN